MGSVLRAVGASQTPIPALHQEIDRELLKALKDFLGGQTPLFKELVEDIIPNVYDGGMKEVISTR